MAKMESSINIHFKGRHYAPEEPYTPDIRKTKQAVFYGLRIEAGKLYEAHFYDRLGRYRQILFHMNKDESISATRQWIAASDEDDMYFFRNKRLFEDFLLRNSNVHITKANFNNRSWARNTRDE